METTSENLHFNGPELRKFVLEDTGYDPLTEPAFAWSNELPCDACELRDYTALVRPADDGETRLCAECYIEAIR